jgi:16S rRNA (uracil1498-N3)-methyltransferase
VADGAARRRELSFTQLVVEDLLPDSILVSGNEARHLLRSLRGRVGDRLLATDGRGVTAELEIVAADREGARLAVVTRTHHDPPARRWWLATRAAGARFDWLVEKAVELGAWGLLPLAAGDGDARRRDRWQRLADAALGQCRGAWAMSVVEARPLPEILAAPPAEGWGAVVWADPAGEPAGLVDPSELPGGDLLLVVGPPEGFSAGLRAELERFPESRAIALGNRRLRSETAALAGLVWACCTGRN